MQPPDESLIRERAESHGYIMKSVAGGFMLLVDGDLDIAAPSPPLTLREIALLLDYEDYEPSFLENVTESLEIYANTGIPIWPGTKASFEEQAKQLVLIFTSAKGRPPEDFAELDEWARDELRHGRFLVPK
jgi:hypothetical protein